MSSSPEHRVPARPRARRRDRRAGPLGLRRCGCRSWRSPSSTRAGRGRRSAPGLRRGLGAGPPRGRGLRRRGRAGRGARPAPTRTASPAAQAEHAAAVAALAEAARAARRAARGRRAVSSTTRPVALAARADRARARPRAAHPDPDAVARRVPRCCPAHPAARRSACTPRRRPLAAETCARAGDRGRRRPDAAAARDAVAERRRPRRRPPRRRGARPSPGGAAMSRASRPSCGPAPAAPSPRCAGPGRRLVGLQVKVAGLDAAVGDLVSVEGAHRASSPRSSPRTGGLTCLPLGEHHRHAGRRPRARHRRAAAGRRRRRAARPGPRRPRPPDRRRPLARRACRSVGGRPAAPPALSARASTSQVASACAPSTRSSRAAAASASASSPAPASASRACCR